jgi:hypothetical protein
MPRINQLPAASSVAQTDVLAIDTTDKTYKVPRSILAPAPYIATIPTGQWSGSGSDRYITITASNVTANAMLYPFYDNASAALLNGPVWAIPAAGSFTIHTSAIPSGTVTISVLLAGIVGEAQYQVLADVYSRAQVDTIVSQSTAWVNNALTNTSILAYAASVANPSFTTFRTSATSTDVPIANEYYIGTVERYGQNITVKMTTMQDASKMYVNNSINGGSTWTGWQLYNSSVNTPYSIKTISESSLIDFDDLWQYGNGIFSIKTPTSSQSSPVSETGNQYWYVFQATFYSDNKYGVQIATRSTNNFNVYMRKRENGVNRAWIRTTFQAIT